MRSSFPVAAVLSVALATLTAGPALGDVLWISAGGGNPVAYRDVRVLRIEDERVFFSTAGREASRPLEQVVRMSLDDEPAFNAAEEARTAGRWEQAAEGYQRAIRSTTRPWLRRFASQRLLESAERSGRFDAAVSAYVALVAADPTLAGPHRPQVPQHVPGLLQSGAGELRQALDDGALNDEQRQMLLGLLVEVERARGDIPAANAAMQQVLELAPNPDDPDAAATLAEMKLAAARLALDQRQYRQALEEIESNSRLFVQANHQAQALYYLAEARHGLAAGRNEPAALKDAALDYMRIAAHFGELADQPIIAPYVAEALMRTAWIHEEIGEPAAALRLYRQVAEQFGDRPAGQRARRNIQRLEQRPSDH